METLSISFPCSFNGQDDAVDYWHALGIGWDPDGI